MAGEIEPVTLEIDDVTIKFRGQIVDGVTGEPIEQDEDGDAP